MRREYALHNFVSDFFSSIDNFFGNFTSIYSFIYSDSDKRVYYNKNESLYLIFHKFNNNYFNDSYIIALSCSTAFDPSKEVFFQENTFCGGYSECESYNGNGSNRVLRNAAYFFPMPSVTNGNLLVANYNSENDTFMFSVIEYISSAQNTTTYRTKSIVFGSTTKYCNFNGGFFYGGDFVYTFERYYNEWYTSGSGGPGGREAHSDGVYCLYNSSTTDIEFHVEKPRPGSGGSWNYPWIPDPYNAVQCYLWGTNMESNNVNTFEVILRADIDNAPNREPHSLIANGKRVLGVEQPFVSTAPDLYSSEIWARTMRINEGVPMKCSISNSQYLNCPSYFPLFSRTYLEQGMTNTLNNTSPVMPLFFMVAREPRSLGFMSALCKNDVINLVGMYNMSTNAIRNIPSVQYQGEDYTYNCFQMGSRRSMFGMLGYYGIAFRQEGD